MGIFRLYSGSDGESHLEEIDLAGHPELTTQHNVTGVTFRETPSGRFSDWHNAPKRQYVINLSGEGGDRAWRWNGEAVRAGPRDSGPRT